MMGYASILFRNSLSFVIARAGLLVHGQPACFVIRRVLHVSIVQASQRASASRLPMKALAPQIERGLG